MPLRYLITGCGIAVLWALTMALIRREMRREQDLLLAGRLARHVLRDGDDIILVYPEDQTVDVLTPAEAREMGERLSGYVDRTSRAIGARLLELAGETDGTPDPTAAF
jgi:hypothetical protein